MMENMMENKVLTLKGQNTIKAPNSYKTCFFRDKYRIHLQKRSLRYYNKSYYLAQVDLNR